MAVEGIGDLVAGPIDIVGDVHGEIDALDELVARLGYDGDGRHPGGRRLVFVGDLVDRGPRTPDVLRLVMGMVENGSALCVPGNHDVKFLRWLNGRNVKPTHGLDLSIAQMENEPSEFRAEVKTSSTGL